MANFPSGPLPLVVEAQVQGVWTDFSRRVRDSDESPGIDITRGRTPESKRVQPSRLSLSFDNRDGALSNRLPTATYYGLLGRNTPLRCRIRWVYDRFGRTNTDDWSTTETGQTWALSGGSVPSEYDVNGAVGTHTHGTVNQLHHSTVTLPAHAQDVTATASWAVLATGGTYTSWAVFGTDLNNYYAAILEFSTAGGVTVQISKRVGGSLSTVVAATGVGGYSGGTQWRVRLQRTALGYLRAKAWLATSTEPTAWTLTSASPDTAFSSFTLAGLLSRRETGNTNASAACSFDDFEVNSWRFWGEVSSWPPKPVVSGTDVTVPIEAAGILRRLGSGVKPLKSPAYRALAALSPASWWPLEDGSEVTAPAAVGGGSEISATVSAPTLAAGNDILLMGQTGPTGAVSAARIGYNIALLAPLPASQVSAVTASAWVKLPGDASTTNYVSMNIKFVAPTATSDVYVQWDLDPTQAALTITYGDTTFASGGPYPTTVSSAWHHIAFTAAESGSDVVHKFYLDGALLGSVTDTASSIYQPQRMVVSNIRTSGAPTGTDFYTYVSGMAYWDSALTADQIADLASAMNGWTGETAADRMTRLFGEEGVPFELVGNADDTAPMGPQRVATLLDNTFDCVDADQGVLYEPRDAFAVGYRTRTSLYNQTGPQLDYATQVSWPWQPTEDDQLVVNDVTARRRNGSFARVTVDTGPLSTQAKPNGVGTYDEDGTYVVAADTQLPDLASWRAHLGTWDEVRLPAVEVNTARLFRDSQPTLAGQAGELNPGDYLSIANPPAWMPPDPVELLAVGSREKLRNYQWTLTHSAAPAGPYNVFVVGDQTRGRLDTAGCIVNEAATSGATSLKLCTTSGPLWITSASRPGDFPFSAGVAGERVSVTAMGSLTAASFVASGATASTVNAAVSPALPAGIAAGDLLLLVAAIGNSGTGTINAVPGYTRLGSSPAANVSVFGRIATSSESPPTVTFTGSAATTDTIGKLFAFRDMCADLDLIVHNSSNQSNTSAQNIATPALLVRQNNCVVVLVGWKQDDWTSAAAPSGFTKIQDSFVTAGDDMGITVAYRIQSTAVDLGPDLFTITGGLSAISNSIAIALVGGTQTATVTRSANTVVKAQAIGNPVAMWRPPAYAL